MKQKSIPFLDESRYLILKLIEQAIRDFYNLERSQTPIEQYHHETVDELLLRCNEQMSGKRGAAVAVVKMYYQEKKIEYSCVGNVRFYMLQQEGVMIYPLPIMGYLSGRRQPLKKQTFNYSEGSRFILHSDGVVLKSPRAVLMQSVSTYELFENVMRSTKQDDDSTLIVGSLLQ